MADYQDTCGEPSTRRKHHRSPSRQTTRSQIQRSPLSPAPLRVMSNPNILSPEHKTSRRRRSTRPNYPARPAHTIHNEEEDNTGYDADESTVTDSQSLTQFETMRNDELALRYTRAQSFKQRERSSSRTSWSIDVSLDDAFYCGPIGDENYQDYLSHSQSGSEAVNHHQAHYRNFLNNPICLENFARSQIQLELSNQDRDLAALVDTYLNCEISESVSHTGSGAAHSDTVNISSMSHEELDIGKNPRNDITPEIQKIFDSLACRPPPKPAKAAKKIKPEKESRQKQGLFKKVVSLVRGNNKKNPAIQQPIPSPTLRFQSRQTRPLSRSEELETTNSLRTNFRLNSPLSHDEAISTPQNSNVTNMTPQIFLPNAQYAGPAVPDITFTPASPRNPPPVPHDTHPFASASQVASRLQLPRRPS